MHRLDQDYYKGFYLRLNSAGYLCAYDLERVHPYVIPFRDKADAERGIDILRAQEQVRCA